MHNDYSYEGLYFITICTKDRNHYFGKIIDNLKFEYSPIGAIAYTYWNEIPKHFKNINLDAFIIMPNHIHGIIEIVLSMRPPQGHPMGWPHNQNWDFCRVMPWHDPTPINSVKPFPDSFQQLSDNLNHR